MSIPFDLAEDQNAGQLPPPLIPQERWKEFFEWARDSGYDESYFDRWDSKSVELQRQYLEDHR